MAGLSRFRPGFRRTATDDASTSIQTLPLDTIETGEKQPATSSGEAAATDDIIAEALTKLPVQDAQRGVQDVEAVTLTWSKKSLIAVFIL
jgi:hypothetical protein